MPLHVPPAPAPALRSVLAALEFAHRGPGGPYPRAALRRGPVEPRTPASRPCVRTGIGAAGTAPGAARPAGGSISGRATAVAPRARPSLRRTDGCSPASPRGRTWPPPNGRCGRRRRCRPRTSRTCCPCPGLYMLALWLHGDSRADAATGAARPDGPAGPAGTRAAWDHRAPAAPAGRSAAGADPAARARPLPLAGSTRGLTRPHAPRPRVAGRVLCTVTARSGRVPRTTRKDMQLRNRPDG